MFAALVVGRPLIRAMYLRLCAYHEGMFIYRRSTPALDGAGVAMVCIPGGIGSDIRGFWGEANRHVVPSDACPPRDGRSRSVCQSLRCTSYLLTCFCREVFPVSYHTDEECAEEAEEGRRMRTWASTTSVSDGCWLVSGGSEQRNGDRRRS